MKYKQRFSAVLFMLAMLLATPAVAEKVTINFNKADIHAFIKFVATFSGKNFLVDNRVKGSVSIVSPTPVSEKEAYEVFLSVLEVHGYAAVPSGSIVKIVPRAEGKQKSLPVRSSAAASDDGMVTHILRLKHADAQQLVAVLRPLVSPSAHLVAYPSGNMLLMTDSASNVRRIQGILKLLDRQDAIGVQMFHLKHASADKLAQTLTALYGATGAATGAVPRGMKGGAGGSTKLLAHQPGNILVAVAAPQVLNEIASVVATLDVAPEADSGRLHVRYLKHANAEDVAKVLNELVGGQASSGAAGATGVKAKSLFTGDVKLVAEPATNALLITADPADITALNSIVDKLDIRRRQVLVEALIVEVSGNAIERFGVEWMGSGGVGAGVQSFQNLPTVGAALTANAAAVPPVSTAAVLAAAAPTGLTLGVVNSALSIGALVHAMQSDTNANVLSTPNILTMDNEEAEIVVGKNVPFITGQSSTQGGITNPFQTIERKDVGLTLRVKPQISEGDSVRLEIFQEISSVDGGTAAEGGLITSKRSIKTVVLANNGQMIVLGGLMREDSTGSVQRVPCFGAIPVLGEPFKFTENTGAKTNLMVFLKPHIIKNDNQIEAITNSKYSDIKKLYEREVGGGTILFPHDPKQMPDKMIPAATSKEKQTPPASPAK